MSPGMKKGRRERVKDLRKTEKGGGREKNKIADMNRKQSFKAQYPGKT